MKLFAYLLILGLTPLFAQEWTGFSAPVPVRSAWASDSGIWLATGGGIRFLSTGMTSRMYTAADGLEETGQSGVVKADDGNLYTVSESGMIARFNSATQRFVVVNRSYVEFADTLRHGLILAHGDYLVLAFGERLSFFRISTGLADVSLSALGTKSLVGHSINDMHLVGDSLYVALDSSVYVREIPFSNLDAEGNFVDPSTWTLVQSFTAPVRNFWFAGSALHVDSLAAAKALFDSTGLVAQVRAGAAGSVQILGKSWNDATFCPTDTCVPTWIVRSPNGTFWLGDAATSLWSVNGMTRTATPAWSGFPANVASQILPLPDGGVVAFASPYMVWWNGTNFTKVTANTLAYGSDNNQSAKQPMKTLQSDGQNTLLWGTWGAGILAYANGGLKAGAPASKQFHSALGSCLDSYDGGGTFEIVNGSAHVPGAGGTLFSYWGNTRNGGIAYASPGAASLTCLPASVSNWWPAAMTAVASPDSTWNIYTSYYNSGDESGGGIDYFSVTNPELSGSFQLLSTTVITGSFGGARALAWDAANQRLWAISANSIGYWDGKLDSMTTVSSLQGFQSSELTALKIDGHSNLWLGTRNNGAYEATMSNGHPDTLLFTPITPRQGLLSNEVIDIAIQAGTGEIWFAHDRGLSRWRNAKVRDASNFQQTGAPPVIAYPNPFRPMIHAHVTFDHLSEGATLRIYDQAGNIVRNFNGSALVGGQFVWDGKNSAGELIAPGLYHWLASLGSHSQHGRLLVIR